MTAGGTDIKIGLGAKLVAAAFAVVVGFALCEVAARAFYARPPELGREPQLLYQSDPELGYFHVPGQSGYLDDGLATINELGFRGSPLAVPKPAGTIRVVAIGDSTTFGWGVGDEETYTTQLETRLRAAFPDRQVEVVNAGVVSYDLDQSTRLLRRFAPTICPDIVLVGLFWNDLPYESISPEGEPQPGRAAAPPAGDSRGDRTAFVPRTFRMANQRTGLDWLLRQSRFLYALRHAWLAVIAPTGAATNQVKWEMALLEGRETPAIDEAWNSIGRTLAEIGSLGEAGGFAVGVVIIPIRAQVEKSHPRAAYQTRVRALAEAQGFFVVDPLPKLVEAPDHNGLFIPFDRMHLSGAGNALMAEAAFEALAARPEFHRGRQAPEPDDPDRRGGTR